MSETVEKTGRIKGSFIVAAIEAGENTSVKKAFLRLLADEADYKEQSRIDLDEALVVGLVKLCLAPKADDDEALRNVAKSTLFAVTDNIGRMEGLGSAQLVEGFNLLKDAARDGDVFIKEIALEAIGEFIIDCPDLIEHLPPTLAIVPLTRYLDTEP